jgi:hypothetical protein
MKENQACILIQILIDQDLLSSDVVQNLQTFGFQSSEKKLPHVIFGQKEKYRLKDDIMWPFCFHCY